MVSNLNGLSTQMSVTLTEMNNTVSRTLEQSASQNTVVSGVANEVGQLSGRLRQQVEEVTNFTTSSTEQFNELIGNMRNQFMGFGEVPQALSQQFQNLMITSMKPLKIKDTSELQGQLSSELSSAVTSLQNVFSEQGLDGMRDVVDRTVLDLMKLRSSCNLINNSCLTHFLALVRKLVHSLLPLTE